MQLPDLPSCDAPIYERIARAVRALIDSGTLQAGDRVPGENVLIKRYGVSRSTARDALALLRRWGLVEARVGSGTYVTGRRLTRKPRRYSRGKPANIGPFASDVIAAGGKPAIEAHTTIEDATHRLSGLLAVPIGTPLVRTDYRFLADSRPIQLSTSWEIEATIADTDIRVPEEGPHGGAGVIARYDTIGLTIDAVSENVIARPADPSEQTQLAISDTYIFQLERTHWAGDRPIEFADIIMSTTSYSLLYAFTVSTQPHTL